MSTTQELLAAKERYDALKARFVELADMLAEYNPGFGDYPMAAHLVRVLLESE